MPCTVWWPPCRGILPGARWKLAASSEALGLGDVGLAIAGGVVERRTMRDASSVVSRHVGHLPPSMRRWTLEREEGCSAQGAWEREEGCSAQSAWEREEGCSAQGAWEREEGCSAQSASAVA